MIDLIDTKELNIEKPVKPVIHRKNPVEHIKPSELLKGTVIKATYITTIKNVGKYGGEAYILDPKGDTGKYISLFSCTSLEYQMKYVEPLDLIKITLRDIKEPQGEKKYRTFDFVVEIQ